MFSGYKTPKVENEISKMPATPSWIQVNHLEIDLACLAETDEDSIIKIDYVTANGVIVPF